jgi:hypothetical protein
MARQPDSGPDGFWLSCDDEQPGCRSVPSARPTWPPCSPTSTMTRTTTTSSGAVGRRRCWRCGSGRASAAPAPPPTPSIGAGGPLSSPPGPAACPGGSSLSSPPAWPPGWPPHESLPTWRPRLGVTVAAGLGWLLRFRSFPDTVAWRCGAAGERRTARLLAPLERRDWAVLHDLAIPGSAANIDHLVSRGVTVVPAQRLPNLLCALPPVLGPERVAWLADRGPVRFRPAA